MIFAGGIGVLGQLLGHHTQLSHLVIGLINVGVSFVLVSVLFAILYKVLPNKMLNWRDVIVGSMGTAILFEAGQALIAIYLSRIVYANVYGAAAGVIVLLVWVYYAAQIFLLGAEFTKVWAKHYGSLS
jgi:membrane protein